MGKRTQIPASVKIDVLIESGYRCAIPTCRTILITELHHIIKVSEDGTNESSNLIALCSNCHGLLHKGIIEKEAIAFYKSMLVSLNGVFDRDSINYLLLLNQMNQTPLVISGDGLIKFSTLISSGFVEFNKRTPKIIDANHVVQYQVQITEKGKSLILAWNSGEKDKVKEVLYKDVKSNG